MTKIDWTRGVAAAIALFVSLRPATASAQDPPAEPRPQSTVTSDDGWYYDAPPERPQKRTIIQEKAALRAEQRMARLAASRWYGISNSRPTASAMPFTTMYSHAWQMPGGRPFAWYVSSRPVIILRSPSPIVYR